MPTVDSTCVSFRKSIRGFGDEMALSKNKLEKARRAIELLSSLDDDECCSSPSTSRNVASYSGTQGSGVLSLDSKTEKGDTNVIITYETPCICDKSTFPGRIFQSYI